MNMNWLMSKLLKNNAEYKKWLDSNKEVQKTENLLFAIKDFYNITADKIFMKLLSMDNNNKSKKYIIYYVDLHVNNNAFYPKKGDIFIKNFLNEDIIDLNENKLDYKTEFDDNYEIISVDLKNIISIKPIYSYIT